MSVVRVEDCRWDVEFPEKWGWTATLEVDREIVEDFMWAFSGILEKEGLPRRDDIDPLKEAKHLAEIELTVALMEKHKENGNILLCMRDILSGEQNE